MRPVFICCILLIAVTSSAQQKALNIPGIHQLVENSKSENKIQKKNRDNQAVISANEIQNKTMLGKLKQKYRSLQERYNTLGTLITAANIGINATPMVNHIIQNQIGIYQIAQNNPSYILLAYESEIQFVSKARSLVNFLIGLSASYGAVNQMKISDRKILFDYILTELNLIQSISSSLLNSMQYNQSNGFVKSLNPFQDYVDIDKDIIQDIMRNAKYLKR